MDNYEIQQTIKLPSEGNQRAYIDDHGQHFWRLALFQH